MTVINLNGHEGAWFEMEGGGRVQLRLLSRSEYQDIERQTDKKKIEYRRVEGRAERFEVRERDEALHDALFWDAIIVNWENLLQGNGEPIPCTRENKLALLDRSNRFRTFVTEALDRLRADEADASERLEKN